jgi:hypothetical protein
MLFSTLFTAYLLAVAGAVAIVTRVWLPPRASWATIALLAVWLAYALLLGVTGFVGQYNRLPPGIAFLVLPVVTALLILTLTLPGAIVARHVPVRLLLGFQLFRLGVELSLHHLWSLGLAPKLMTLGGGNIEILVAITAPAAAWLAPRGPLGRRIAWSWNLIGLLSLANVVIRAVLSTPGPFNILRAEVPDVAILTYPFTFIPGFMAPLAMTLHILAFRAIQSESGSPRPLRLDSATGRPN